MAATEPPQAATEHHTSTGISNLKLGMWTFLGSECLFFGALISTYLLYRGRSTTGPFPEDVYDIPFTSVSSFVLLMSSLTMVLALAAVRAGRVARFQTWTLATALLGTLFLGAMFLEYTIFFAEGFTPATSPFSSAFFVLTGFHGLHVVVGIVMLVGLWASSVSGRLDHSRHDVVADVSIYWHLVDVVWILIFAVVYLVPAL